MKIDLQKLLDSGNAEKVARLATLNKDNDFDIKIHNESLEMIDRISKELVVVRGNGNVELSNMRGSLRPHYLQSAIKTILHKYDLDDIIEDLGKELVENWGFEDVSHPASLQTYVQVNIFLITCDAHLRILDAKKDWYTYTGKIPTSRRFLAELFELLGITKPENR